MMGRDRSAPVSLNFVSGVVYTNPNSQAVTLPVPHERLYIRLEAETGDVYYAINAVGASAASSGFVAQDDSRWIGPMGNLNSLHVHAAAAVIHIQFWREV